MSKKCTQRPELTPVFSKGKGSFNGRNRKSCLCGNNLPQLPHFPKLAKLSRWKKGIISSLMKTVSPYSMRQSITLTVSMFKSRSMASKVTDGSITKKTQNGMYVSNDLIGQMSAH